MPDLRSPTAAGLCIALLAVPWVVRAQADTSPACIEVEFIVERIRDYACFSRRLAAAPA
jgi:hypothetical protein